MHKATLHTDVGIHSPASPPIPVSPLRIALMLESDGPGGAEVMLLRLARELRRRGHHPIHVGPDNGCGWLGERFREIGVERETFSIRRPLDLRCLQGLLRTLRRREVDIVHSHEFTMTVYGAAAARWLGRPHILTHHSNLYFSRRWRRRLAMRWACRSSATVAVSKITRSELETHLGLKPGSVGVVYNGVDFRPGAREPVRREFGASADEVLILALGTVEPRKGHILLLRALAELRRRRPELAWRLAIGGQDRFETAARLRAFAIEHGLDDRLHLLGHRDDIPNLLAAADLFAMPSLHEGLPLALLEAMRAGLPVVASQAGGIPEAVTPGQDGFLVPVGDVPALGHALERLLADSALRTATGERGRRRAEAAFTVQVMTSAYERLYHAAVRAKRR